MHFSDHTNARVVLIRHARSSHVHTGWIDSSGFRAWRSAYDDAGISADERVPPILEKLAALPSVVIASDTARAVATAQLLAPGGAITVSPLFREMDLEGPSPGRLRMPLHAWSVAVGWRILGQALRRRYPSAEEAGRSKGAADMLDKVADQHALIIVVTHAMFRRRLSARLMQIGWQREGSQRSIRPWSAWQFVRRTDIEP